MNHSIMNTPVSNSTLSDPPKRLFSIEAHWTYNFLLPTWPVIIVFGLLANLTNIVVFLKAGIKDNVTTLMLSLSVSDLLYLTIMSSSPYVFIVSHFADHRLFPFDTNLITELLYWPAMVFYDFSALISVWLGVTRCACVAMPLKFKSVFTKTRTVKLVLASFVLALSLRIPILSVYRIARRTDPDTNVSYVYLAKHNRKAMTRINDVLNRNSLQYIYFIIMITCVCVLSFKLHQASAIRRSHSSTPAPQSEQASEKPDNQGMSSKDVRVIKSVVMVCSIFITSQAPFLIYSTVRLINPEFDVFAKLNNLFVMSSTISRTCSYLNASVNIFVYYNFNSKYKSVCLSMFRKRKFTYIKNNINNTNLLTYNLNKQPLNAT
ncbi:chemosensory receptor a [Plakobranchus ocellatus]|uniref:Chemosensory receptor a n=1 Tax=Plakobranchus ocellatus TaxID=259542 RepID=A0AAV4DNL1_9GAST|nr:chemosensory receptor a [Plakobranchus ocellatus]